MKRIYFLFLMTILFSTSISQAAVNYTEGYLSGFLGADDNPIRRVLNSDGTHRATSKVTLRAQVTAGCTVTAGSYGTLDMAPTGSIKRGNAVVHSFSGAVTHTIGASRWFPTSKAERRYAMAHNPRPGHETSQTGTYVLNGKATFTRSSDGGINQIEYLGVAAGTNNPAAIYASEIGQRIDSEVVTMTTRTLSESVSGNACRVMIISSSGSVSLDDGCAGNGNCPPRQWHGSMQRRHGRCGGDRCNCSSDRSDSQGSGPGCSNNPDYNFCTDDGACSTRSGSGVPGECGHNYCCCAPYDAPTYDGGNGGSSSDSTDNTPDCSSCTEGCSSCGSGSDDSGSDDSSDDSSSDDSTSAGCGHIPGHWWTLYACDHWDYTCNVSRRSRLCSSCE